MLSFVRWQGDNVSPHPLDNLSCLPCHLVEAEHNPLIYIDYGRIACPFSVLLTYGKKAAGQVGIKLAYSFWLGEQAT
jgi:hypothetical protein